MEAVALLIVLLAALAVLVLTVRILVTAVKQSRQGQLPTERQRSQVMLLGTLGLVLVLVALLIPSLF